MNLDGFLQFSSKSCSQILISPYLQLSFKKCPKCLRQYHGYFINRNARALAVSGLNVQVPRTILCAIYFLIYARVPKLTRPPMARLPTYCTVHTRNGPRSDFHGVFATVVCQWSRILATIRSISVSADLKSRPLIHAVDNRRG